eukprot:6505111-Prorocentrum_lima.AAC.1
MPHRYTCSSERAPQAPSQRTLRSSDISCVHPPKRSRLQPTPIVNHCFLLISTAEMFCMTRAWHCMSSFHTRKRCPIAACILPGFVVHPRARRYYGDEGPSTSPTCSARQHLQREQH